MGVHVSPCKTIVPGFHYAVREAVVVHIFDTSILLFLNYYLCVPDRYRGVYPVGTGGVPTRYTLADPVPDRYTLSYSALWTVAFIVNPASISTLLVMT